MTEKECLAAGIAVSLFAHFALLIAPRPPEPEPSFTTVGQMDMASPAVATSREKGIGIAAASPPDMDKADAADRKRQAFLRYLDDIDEETLPLGAALYAAYALSVLCEGGEK